MASRANREGREILVRKETRVGQAMLDRLGRPDHRETRVTTVRQASRAILGPKEIRENKVLWVPQVPKESPDQGVRLA